MHSLIKDIWQAMATTMLWMIPQKERKVVKIIKIIISMKSLY